MKDEEKKGRGEEGKRGKAWKLQDDTSVTGNGMT
jgi:hypothetical protein